MAKTAKHHAKHLPTKPPKRTGKRMPPPEDPDEQTIGSVMAGEAPKQKRLPTMEDNKLDDLEAAAENYADIRDRRMALTEQEVDLKAGLLKIMKDRGKATYKRDGIECRIVAKDETVRVKIKKED